MRLAVPRTQADDVLDQIARRDFPFPIRDHIVGLMEVGSGAHGTKLDPSNPHFIDDTDIMGIVVPPVEFVIGLRKWEHAVWHDSGTDFVLYEWGKFVRLLLKSNPNVLCTLWIDEPILSLWPLDELRRNRAAFASQEAYKSFSGYAYAQTKKMLHMAYQGYMGEKRKQLVDRYGYDCKNAAHAIRLFRMGIEFLRTGEMLVRRPDAEELKAIKSGAWTLGEVDRATNAMEREAREARDNSTLPEHPDAVSAERILLKGYDFKWLERARP